METTLSCVDGTAFFSSDEPKWKKRIKKLAEERPGEVEIIRRPEENDGCVYCKIPASYVKIQPKKTRDLTDEQRLEIKEKLAKSHRLKA